MTEDSYWLGRFFSHRVRELHKSIVSQTVSCVVWPHAPARLTVAAMARTLIEQHDLAAANG